MDVLDWYRLFSWLTLLAQGALTLFVAVGVAAWLAPTWRPRFAGLRELLHDQGLALAALVAVVATSGSLYLSEGAHLVPCRLCWFQRVAMYPLAIVLPIAAVRRDWSIRPYAIALAVLGAVVSTWHYLIEWFPSLEDVGGSCDPNNPCSALPLPRRYGYQSIPLMAGTAFVCIAVALGARSTRGRNP